MIQQACEICGEPLPEQGGTGRRRRYCPPPRGCKQVAYRRRGVIHSLTDTQQALALRNEKGMLRNEEEQQHVPLKPFLKYPGAKWRLAQWIVPFFPPHYHYLEPYAGSAACFFLKEPAAHEVLNDLNGGLMRLFRVIRTHGAELAKQIEMTPWSEEEYHECDRHYQENSGDEIEDARRFLVKCWQTHGMKFDVSAGWKHNGLHGKTHPVRLWGELPERLLAVVDRLRQAELRNRNALDMIAYYNDPTCLIYADPPYIRETRTGGKLYQHEMTLDDHDAMLEALDRHKGTVVLSGYAHPLYDERLAHWYRVTTASVAEHGNKRIEVLWLNRKAAHCQQLSLFTV